MLQWLTDPNNRAATRNGEFAKLVVRNDHDLELVVIGRANQPPNAAAYALLLFVIVVGMIID